jgi:hypothetical protein
MSTPALESTDRVVLKWISGKQTRSRQLTPLTLAPSARKLAAAEPTAELARDTHPSAMLMDVTSTHTAWVTPLSTELD